MVVPGLICVNLGVLILMRKRLKTTALHHWWVGVSGGFVNRQERSPWWGKLSTVVLPSSLPWGSRPLPLTPMRFYRRLPSPSFACRRPIPSLFSVLKVGHVGSGLGGQREESDLIRPRTPAGDGRRSLCAGGCPITCRFRV